MLTLAATNRANGQSLELVIGDAVLAQFMERLRGELLKTQRDMTRKEYAEHKGVHIDTVKEWLRLGLPKHQQRRRSKVFIPVAAADQWLAGKGVA